MKTVAKLASGALVACSGLIACQHQAAPASGTATRVKGENVSAVSAIADARCDREARCGSVGPDKTYATRDVCLEAVRTEWDDELNAYECPGGVVQKELNECVSEVRNEDCGNPFDTMGRAVACRSNKICVEQPQP